MNARKLLNWFQTKTGQFVLFAILIAIFLTAYYGFRVRREGTGSREQKAHAAAETGPSNSFIKTVLGTAVPFFAQPAATNAPGKPAPPPAAIHAPPPLPPLFSVAVPLPNNSNPPERYAPYGRLISCQLVITVDSSRIQTPIVGMVTEDVWHKGKRIISAGTEVHGFAQLDRSRERIASQNNWILVFRDREMNGFELPLTGFALDREKEPSTDTWAVTDGSAGLKGEVIKTDNMAEAKFFASTFLAGAASGLVDQTTTTGAYGTSTSIQGGLQTAAANGVSQTLQRYAQEIMQAIQRDGMYVRVPAGKQFYLYVTETIDLDKARVGDLPSRASPSNRAASPSTSSNTPTQSSTSTSYARPSNH